LTSRQIRRTTWLRTVRKIFSSCCVINFNSCLEDLSLYVDGEYQVPAAQSVHTTDDTPPMEIIPSPPKLNIVVPQAASGQPIQRQALGLGLPPLAIRHSDSIRQRMTLIPGPSGHIFDHTLASDSNHDEIAPSPSSPDSDPPASIVLPAHAPAGPSKHGNRGAAQKTRGGRGGGGKRRGKAAATVESDSTWRRTTYNLCHGLAVQVSVFGRYTRQQYNLIAKNKIIIVKWMIIQVFVRFNY
jgi:hypothetical protein